MFHGEDDSRLAPSGSGSRRAVGAHDGIGGAAHSDGARFSVPLRANGGEFRYTVYDGEESRGSVLEIGG